MIESTDESGGFARFVGVVGVDVAWLAAAIGTGFAVHLVYLYTHPYPGFGAGLYLQMAAEIAANGYGLPARIPGYTADGIPFAYPPLPLYVLALLTDVGRVDPLVLSRLLPGAVVVLCLVPYFGTAKELTGSTAAAGLATVLFAATPAVLRWHLSAGGIVRAVAFLFTAIGLYTGARLFKADDRRFLVPSAVAFGLTVLSHPVYTAFFGVSYVVYVWFYDRTLRGVATGAMVAGGGVLLAAPWWLSVGATHGFDVFTGAASTHSGLGGGIDRLLDTFVRPLAPDAEAPIFLAAYAGGAYCLYRRQYALVSWLVVAGYVVGKSRFLFVPGAMLIAILVLEGMAPRIESAIVRWRGPRDPLRRVAPAAVVALVVVGAWGLGGAYVAGGLTVWHDSASQPAFIDDEDREAMGWVRTNTEPDADFVVLGDAAEWFPALTDRPILVGHWGVEWEGSASYRAHLDQYRAVSTCVHAQCVSATLASWDLEPAYVYAPKGEYTIRGEAYEAPERLTESMESDEDYQLVYENDGVAIFRVVREQGAVDRQRVKAAGLPQPVGSSPTPNAETERTARVAA